MLLAFVVILVWEQFNEAAAIAAKEGAAALALQRHIVSFEDDRKGAIAPGLLADLAVFDTNLAEAATSNPARLLAAKVRDTIVGGRVVHAP